MSDYAPLVIMLEENRLAYRPGEMIRGQAAWALGSIPLSAIIRIGWNTAGKGAQNSQIIESLALPVSAAREQVPFEIHAPQNPYSFSGRLVSLIWAIELITEPASHLMRTEITISPSAKEIDLYRYAETK